MNATHVCGPWHVWYAAKDVVLVKSGDRTVARVLHGNFEPTPFDVAETAATAALISSAPELMQALRELRQEANPSAWQKVDAALAKAQTPVHGG